MRAQRARQAVKSNESERVSALHPIGAHKNTIHEAHIGMEGIWGSFTGGQIGSGSGQVEIGLADNAFEVEDYRGIASLGVNTTRVRGCCCAADGSREIEMGPARWRNIDVRDRHRKIAKSGQTFFLCPHFAWNTGADQRCAATVPL